MLVQAGIALCCLITPTQDPDAGSAEVRRESAFARALAYDFRFTDLSEVVLDRALAKADGTDRSRLLLDRCDIRKLAAGTARDSASKVVALQSAGEAYQEFLASSPPAGLANEARVSLGELAYDFGSTLGLLFETTPPPAEQKKELIATAEDLFRTTLQGLNEVISVWEQMDSESKDSTRFTTYFPSMFYKSMVFYHWAALYPPGSIERNSQSEQAISSLEQFALLAGDNSRAGFMGYKHMADVYAMRAEHEMAEAFYEHVLMNCVNADADYAPAERDGRERVVQDAYLSYLRYRLGLGQLAQARQLGENFQNWIEEEGIFLKDPGYRTMLQLARLSIEDGEFGEAIGIARMVAEENTQSVLRLEANQVMAEAIDSAPADAEIDLQVLFAAAEGAFLSKKFDECLPLFMMLLPRLESSRQGDEFGARTYYYLGRAYGYLDRELESAISFEQGYERYGSDEDHGAKIADLWLKSATRFRDKASGDPDLNDFYNRAIEAVKATSAAPDQAIWRDAESLYEKAKELGKVAAGKGAVSAEARAALAALDDAKRAYQNIQRGSRYYERAIVKQGLCDYRGGFWEPERWESAHAAFQDYVDVYVQDPQNSPTDAAGRKAQTEETARADYYLGRIRLEQAKAGDAGAWEKVLQEYEGYLERHPEQTKSYGIASHLHCVQALIALDRIDQAIARYEVIANGGFDDKSIASAAYMLFSYYLKEIEGSQGDAQLLAQQNAANYLNITNQRTPRPTWQNRVKEARLRMDIGEAATAGKIFEDVLDRYEITGNSLFFVEMDLIGSYLAQDKAGAAMPLLEGILERDPRKANSERVLDALVKSLAGWPELREGRVVEILGVGGDDETFTKAAEYNTTQQRIAENDAAKNNINRFQHPGWIRARLQYAYILYGWGQVVPAKKGKHLDLVNSYEKLDPGFAAVSEYAGEDAAKIFLWLKTR